MVKTLKVFADTADMKEMKKMLDEKIVQGFTTNPTLMRKAGVTDYTTWGIASAALVAPFPISLEVVSDDPVEMLRQARILSSFGDNVYVKLPITNTKGVLMRGLIDSAVLEGIKVNVTAVMTEEQIQSLAALLVPAVPSICSVFAGRIQDTGRRATPIIASAVTGLRDCGTEVLWASSRQAYDFVQAHVARANIITMTPDLIKKLALTGKDLSEFSRETVEMFHIDAQAAGYVL